MGPGWHAPAAAPRLKAWCRPLQMGSRGLAAGPSRLPAAWEHLQRGAREVRWRLLPSGFKHEMKTPILVTCASVREHVARAGVTCRADCQTNDEAFLQSNIYYCVDIPQHSTCKYGETAM